MSRFLEAQSGQCAVVVSVDDDGSAIVEHKHIVAWEFWYEPGEDRRTWPILAGDGPASNSRALISQPYGRWEDSEGTQWESLDAAARDTAAYLAKRLAKL
jgi:hypothetical protein